MNLFSRTMSINKLLLLTYAVFWIPTLFICWSTYQSVQAHIQQMQHSSSQNPAAGVVSATLNSDSPLLLRTIRKWRVRDSDYQPQLPMVESILDLQFAFFLTIAIVFLLGALVLWLLQRYLSKPIEKINDSIADLAAGKLVQPIETGGLQDIVAVGEQLENLRLHMNQTEKLQVHFLRHISHEIKTPLTSIKEGTHLLKDEVVGQVSDEQREIIDILSNSSKELQQSIENLLDYNSAITIGKIRQREVVNLTELVVEVLEKHALTIRSKGLKIESSLPNQRAFIDREQIRTVFDNLMSNAVKYSPNNGTIWLLTEKREDSALFTIKDQGPGIKKEQHGAVFDPFFIGDQPSRGPLKGTGLGLSIARQYVEAHQGSLKLVDTPKGALFEVWLPA